MDFSLSIIDAAEMRRQALLADGTRMHRLGDGSPGANRPFRLLPVPHGASKRVGTILGKLGAGYHRDAATLSARNGMM